MNLFNILSDIEKIDADAVERFQFSRRKLLRKTATAAAATPAILATTLNKAFAAEADVVAVLNFALLLEYLEAEFYTKALEMPMLIHNAERGVFTTIAEHEQDHVNFLKGALMDKAIPKPTFDFNAAGLSPFTNYEHFLILSQAFEDLGVRAYKGQAPVLMENRQILLAALKIHSVEARHAAEVRLIRGLRVWPSEEETGGAPAPVYFGENKINNPPNNDLVALAAPHIAQREGDVMANARKFAHEAFDEPLTKEEVLAIAGPFVKM